MIAIRDCKLYIGLYPASRIAEQYGTPVYVYDEDTIIERVKEVKYSIDGVVSRIYYSLKANPNPYIAWLLYSEGLGLEAVSPGELYLAHRLGVDPSRVMFTGNSTSIEDLYYAVRLGVEINVDSASSAKKLCRLGYRGEVGIRVNPLFGAGYHKYTITGGHGSKFGVAPSQVGSVASLLRECGISVKRLHAHVGSGIADPGLYVEVFEFLYGLARDIGSVEELDIGGGFAVPYKPTDKRFPWRRFGEMLRQAIEDLGAENYEVIVEPGRYFVAEAGVLLARVADVKEDHGVIIVGTNTGINHLIRPALYNAYHEVIIADNACVRNVALADVVGNVCESSDVLARGRLIPQPREGDIIAILNAGAYAMSMASNYNMRPLPSEIVVTRDNKIIVTRRRQVYEDLVRDYTWWPK